MVKTDKVEHNADFLVVGAGVIGCSTAYNLALQGAKVLVIDVRGIGDVQSSKSWGFCRQQGRDIKEVPLMLEAMKRWSQLDEELGFCTGWQQEGNLALCDGPKRAEEFKKWIPYAEKYGVDTSIVDGQQIQKLLPGIATDMVGMWTPSDGSADPEHTTLAFANAAKRLGVKFNLFTSPVSSLIHENNQVRGVHLADGTRYFGGTTILATGGWTGELLRGIAILPVLRIRSTAAWTVPVTELGSGFESFPSMGVWAPRCAFRRRLDGRITISDGGFREEHDFEAFGSMVHGGRYIGGFLKHPVWVNVINDISHHRDPNPRPARIDQACSTFAKLFPNLPKLRIDRIWASHMDMTPDMLPVMDAGDDLPNRLTVSCGFSGHGLGISPAAGRLTADMALSGTRPPEADAFRVGRFREKFFTRPQCVL